MSHRLPFRRIMLETDPGIHHGSHYTAHEEYPDRLPLSRIQQREHPESRTKVPCPDKRHEWNRWRRGGRNGDAERVTECLRGDDAVNAAAEGEDTHPSREKREAALNEAWEARHLF